MTYTSVLEVWNAALSSIGGASRVSSIEQESREAEACRRWYPLVRDTVQESAWWPGGKKVERLLVLAETTEESWNIGQPEPGWMYTYVLPDDYLRAWFSSMGAPFSISLFREDAEDEGRIALHSNEEELVLTYSARQPNPALWTPTQTEATVMSLAAVLCIPLLGNQRLADRYAGFAAVKVAEAQAQSLNSEQSNYEFIPDWIAARTGASPRLRFAYPFGSLFTASGPFSAIYDGRNQRWNAYPQGQV